MQHLAEVYLAHQTAIVPVLQALVAHPEFAASAGAKVRTPTDDVVATYRALDVAVRRPVDGDSTANTLLYQTSNIGLTPFGWARPDGQPETGGAETTYDVLLCDDVVFTKPAYDTFVASRGAQASSPSAPAEATDTPATDTPATDTPATDTPATETSEEAQ